MTSSEFIGRRKEGNALVVTIDNPPVNALNFRLLGELVEAILEGNKDPEIRGIIITGAGSRAFCAGGDIKEWAELSPEDGERFTRMGYDSFGAIENSPKPVIAAINGLALGGGVELAMSCDLRIATENAKFGQTEVTLGVIPGWGGTQRMPRLIGKAKAMELILSGQTIDAQEAFRVGLVNKTVPQGEELKAAVDYVSMLAARTSPLAVALAKTAINKGLQEPYEEGLRISLEATRVIANSRDVREGFEAFLFKRPPKFTGE